ncbi:MAG TPA: SLC13 family permease [Longimicrobiales bacterium]|nr:SLC13 family permease [Longimicrobiales bacterium]
MTLTRFISRIYRGATSIGYRIPHTPLRVTTDQIIVFAVVVAALVMFAWNRLRYDVVAVLALLALALTGLVPPGEVFAGFGHPAVVTVAGVLVLSRGLVNAGVVDSIARRLTLIGDRPTVQVAALTGIVILSSGVMNNIGALALLMPVAIWMSRKAGRSPSLLLMPLAFGSLLGGSLTLIGTPPNIIIAAYRTDVGAPPFGMFDFLPVGAIVSLFGLVFIALVGWRLTPRRADQQSAEDLFEISGYMAEVRVPKGSGFADRPLHELLVAVRGDADILVVGLVRADELREMPTPHESLEADDILLVEADSDNLAKLLDITRLELAADASKDAARKRAQPGALTLAEAIVTPGSMLVGQTARSLDLRMRHGVNIMAVAREGHRLRERLGLIRFVAGDILLLQGRKESLQSALNELGCLPLASRGVRIGQPRNVLLATVIFAAAIILIALDLVAPATALVAGAVVMVLTGLIAPTDVYKSIDMPLIVLLAALLPLGHALETSGGSNLMADGLLATAGALSPGATLAVLMGGTMLLSNVINNAAAAVLAAPIAIGVAQGLDASADPFLMAVAIGASSAFLTPIGHQSNTLVMTPGGYRFGDYWRMGLPLSIIVVAVAVPAIMWVWPM